MLRQIDAFAHPAVLSVFMTPPQAPLYTGYQKDRSNEHEMDCYCLHGRDCGVRELSVCLQSIGPGYGSARHGRKARSPCSRAGRGGLREAGETCCGQARRRPDGVRLRSAVALLDEDAEAANGGETRAAEETLAGESSPTDQHNQKSRGRFDAYLEVQLG